MLYNYILNDMNELLHHLKELIFPTSCAGCGNTEGEMVCPSCLRSIPWVSATRCSRCGCPTLYPVDECNDCRGRSLRLDRTVALALFEEPMKSIIHKFKYGGGKRLAPLLAALLAARVQEEGFPFHVDMITFVPLHPRKERERGYNQSRLIAESLAGHLGLECVLLLSRTRNTPSQAGLSLRERETNLKNCIEIEEGKEVGRGIILVDDVFTTGSTLSECSKALRKGGAREVMAAVLARDVRKPTEYPN